MARGTNETGLQGWEKAFLNPRESFKSSEAINECRLNFCEGLGLLDMSMSEVEWWKTSNGRPMDLSWHGFQNVLPMHGWTSEGRTDTQGE